MDTPSSKLVHPHQPEAFRRPSSSLRFLPARPCKFAFINNAIRRFIQDVYAFVKLRSNKIKPSYAI